MKKLVAFDLDKTLLNGDTPSLWNEYLIEKGHINRSFIAEFMAQNNAINRAYHENKLDEEVYKKVIIDTVKHIKKWSLEERNIELQQFIEEKIKPKFYQQGISMIEKYQKEGYDCLLISASVDYLVNPIGLALKFLPENIIGTRLKVEETGYLGDKIIGSTAFKEGKLIMFKEWIKLNNKRYQETVFFSDSYNDRYLLLEVDTAIIINGDPKLIALAKEKKWQCLSFKE